MPDNISDEQWQPIDNEIFAGRKIQAIKLYREAIQTDLKTAKDAVDQRDRDLRAASPEAFKTPAGKGCMSCLMLVLVVAVALVFFF